MIKDFFPRGYRRYSTLPVLGSILNEFTEFLTHLGYPRSIVCLRLRITPTIDKRLRKRRCSSIKMVTRNILRACAPAPGHSQEEINVAATTNLLERYFDEQRIFSLENPDPIESKLITYRHYLQNVRGFSLSTVHNHCMTISQFLSRFDKRGGLAYLPKLTPQDIEDYVRDTGKKIKRGSLQHNISHLRAFLRFLAACGETSKRLDLQIDTPRIYREEQLPHSLDGENVYALLKSIDRSTAIGKRDYAMLLLITTYGLRASEVVTLKLEDIKWRTCQLQIFQRKTATPILFPLTDSIGESIVIYLREGRPPVPYREIFVRHRAPTGILKPTAVTEVFQCWARRSGLKIPFQGVHCLRHSLAVHLLRQGNSLKTIGDLLGHKSFESTCVYLRLNIEDLRTVPLSFPYSLKTIKGEKS